MEFRKLRHFLAVIDTGSLADAARKSNISQPALSKSIHSLEQEIGSPLFNRSVRGMTPTTAARAIEKRIRIISSEIERTYQEIREIQGAARGRIAIGTGPTLAHTVLPKAVGRLLHKTPNVEISVVDGFIDTLLPAVESGAIDFALLTLTPLIRREDFETEVVIPKDPTFAVTNSQNPLASKRRLSLKDLHDQPWALVREPDQLRSKLNHLFAEANLSPPRLAVEFTSASIALGALRESHLISFLPDVLVRTEIQAGTLTALPVPQLSWNRSVGAVYRRGSQFSPAARALLTEVQAICGKSRSR